MLPCKFWCQFDSYSLGARAFAVKHIINAKDIYQWYTTLRVYMYKVDQSKGKL